MALHSMTGYANAQLDWPPADQNASRRQRLGLEIRSVNSRFLDLTLRLPDELRIHETALRELLSQQLRRGKVELRIYTERTGHDGPTEPGPTLLQHLNRVQDTVWAWLPQAQPLSVAEVMRLAEGQGGGIDVPAATLTQWVKRALKQLNDARQREGDTLAQALLNRTRELKQLAEQAQPLVTQLVEQQKQKFLDRWQEALKLVDGTVNASSAQDRALTEATAFAIRIDVAEEIIRLQSHLHEIERLLQSPPAEGVGKRLDFLIQELHREANTLGSKSAVLEMTRISIDMKVLIEQLREQVQNLE
ncbi:MAG: YicC/YloC family endoribonuclease [Alphaproteobacteria bacterium]|nr:YicC/YloC family endoribonuclease [Alphaproteobacteria bacterium]